MKTWMTAVGIVAVGVVAIAAVVTMAAAQPGYGTGVHGGGGHSDYRAVDRWLKEFDQVVLAIHLPAPNATGIKVTIR